MASRPLRSTIRRLFGDGPGNAAIEYPLTVGGIGVVGVGGASLIGSEAAQIFDVVGFRMCQAVNDVCSLRR